MLHSYDVGDQVVATVTFRDVVGAVADPSQVKVIVMAGDGTVTSNVYPTSVSKDSVGVYHLDVILSGPGRWWIRGQGTGSLTAAEEVELLVATQRVVG